MYSDDLVVFGMHALPTVEEGKKRGYLKRDLRALFITGFEQTRARKREKYGRLCRRDDALFHANCHVSLLTRVLLLVPCMVSWCDVSTVFSV
ncbi:hypothetical protein Zmor_027462 [Zophobas morio]|uniref:Uncharacterized protein n=1 Tax=Zophobas morio TaxID=2755281 RepID=A0AA38M2Z9_9CUCU|nr:hypothetical protein Zmor_027462 [Zophobas morio]